MWCWSTKAWESAGLQAASFGPPNSLDPRSLISSLRPRRAQHFGEGQLRLVLRLGPRPGHPELRIKDGVGAGARPWWLTAAVLTGRGPVQAHVMLSSRQRPEGLHAFACRCFAVKGLIVQGLHNVLQRASCAHVKVTVFTWRTFQGKLLTQKLHNPGRLSAGSRGAQAGGRWGRREQWAGGGRVREEGKGSEPRDARSCPAPSLLIRPGCRRDTRSCFYILKLSWAPPATSQP